MRTPSQAADLVSRIPAHRIERRIDRRSTHSVVNNVESVPACEGLYILLNCERTIVDRCCTKSLDQIFLRWRHRRIHIRAKSTRDLNADMPHTSRARMDEHLL